MESPGFKRQEELMGNIQNGGHNIVTCGMCGNILLVRTSDEEHECAVCHFTGEPSEFPDYINL